jgi:siroheme synthase-like protein
MARRFRAGDLQGAWLVFAATNDQALNEAVYRAATRRCLFANVVDQKPLCSFLAPATARRGALTIAVSTGGLSPTLAKRLRDEVIQVGAAYEPLVQFLGSLRARAQRQLPTYQDRQRYFERLVGDARIPGWVRQGRLRLARRAAVGLLHAPRTRR